MKIRRTHETPGMKRGRVVLHNDTDPCDVAKRLDDYTVLDLADEVSPRTELKRLCKKCEWPGGAEESLRQEVNP